MGWSSYANGHLVTVAESEFDVFVTADANMMHQQSLTSRKNGHHRTPPKAQPIA